MLINVTSTEQTIYIFISDGGSFCNRGVQGRGHLQRWGAGGEMVSRKVLGFSCILDTFYDNLKARDLVYFIS